MRRRPKALPRCAMRCPCSASPRPTPTRMSPISSSGSALLPSATRSSNVAVHGRAEDRRAVGFAALRERRVRAGRDARRRRRRRGHHRQSEDDRRHSRKAEGLGLARGHRDTRRGLYDLCRIPVAEGTLRSGRRPGLRQSAQHGGRVAAPEGPVRHRQPQPQILCLRLGLHVGGSGADAVRFGAEIRATGGSRSAR